MPLNATIDAFSKSLEKQLGAKFIANKPDDIVNGFINTYVLNDKRVYEINLYTYDEEPTFHEFEYKGRIIERGRKSIIRKPLDLTVIEKKVNDII